MVQKATRAIRVILVIRERRVMLVTRVIRDYKAM